jgi:Protein of unknown function (DUF4054)
MADAFGPIPPNPATDTFVFDFTAQAKGAIITAAQWLCTVDPVSPVPDPAPETRIIEVPTFSGAKTSAIIGTMVDGCQYILQVQVTLDDDRVLTDSAGVKCTSVMPPPDPSDPLTPAQFRALFPAFSDPNVYSDAMIQMWLNICPIQYGVWGDLYQLGMGLWVAHELAKFGPNGLADRGGAGGIGFPGSKSVGGVSLSYDYSLGADPEAGQYNMTLYGRQFWSMMKYLPIGPFQFGAPGPANWPYPYPWITVWGGPWPITALRVYTLPP